MLQWTYSQSHPSIEAASPAANGGTFRIFYDDVMYWDSFTGMSPTQDLASIQAKAQEIHDSYK
jgi:hypothetical protein